MSDDGRMVVSLGECMVELARGPDGRFGLAYGGDTFNTAVYLARAGLPVRYVTRLGDDPYSAEIIRTAASEGIATDLIGVEPGRMPGLYLIETGACGERSFHYWRDRAPARQLFEADSAAAELVADAIASARAVYFSGVTLSLYSPDGLDRMAAALERARARGATIVMDSNYRPRGWNGDRERARAGFARFWGLADMALPTFDDEQALWDDRTPDDTIARLRAFGLSEVAIKLGADGALVVGADGMAAIACPERLRPVDTTAAGDAFNAAYLASRLRGGTPNAAALAGHRLAGVVIAHRGAVVPRTATAALLEQRTE